jgi:hypothetical protein
MPEPGRAGLRTVRVREGLCLGMHLPNKHRATSQREHRRFLFQEASSGVLIYLLRQAPDTSNGALINLLRSANLMIRRRRPNADA